MDDRSGTNGDNEETSRTTIRCSGPIRPPVVSAIVKRSRHSSETWRELHAHFAYKLQRRESQRCAQLEKEREVKRQRLQIAQQLQDSLFPPNEFVSFQSTLPHSADIKGSVLLPGREGHLKVTGCVLHVERKKDCALVALCPHDNTRIWHTLLCIKRFLPEEITKSHLERLQQHDPSKTQRKQSTLLFAGRAIWSPHLRSQHARVLADRSSHGSQGQ